MTVYHHSPAYLRFIQKYVSWVWNKDNYFDSMGYGGSGHILTSSGTDCKQMYTDWILIRLNIEYKIYDFKFWRAKKFKQ